MLSGSRAALAYSAEVPSDRYGAQQIHHAYLTDAYEAATGSPASATPDHASSAGIAVA